MGIRFNLYIVWANRKQSEFLFLEGLSLCLRWLVHAIIVIIDYLFKQYVAAFPVLLVRKAKIYHVQLAWSFEYVLFVVLIFILGRQNLGLLMLLLLVLKMRSHSYFAITLSFLLVKAFVVFKMDCSHDSNLVFLLQGLKVLHSVHELLCVNFSLSHPKASITLWACSRLL